MTDSPARPDVDALADSLLAIAGRCSNQPDSAALITIARILRATPASGETAEGADQIRAADLLPPEATFNNAPDMLRYLNDPAPPKPAHSPGTVAPAGHEHPLSREVREAFSKPAKPAPDAMRTAMQAISDLPMNTDFISEVRRISRETLAAPVPSPDGVLTTIKDSPCENINVSSIRAVISSGQATKTKSNNSSIVPVTELPESVRIPLHSLQADLEYLIGRVIVDDSCGPMIIKSIRKRLKQIEVALSPSDAGAAEPNNLFRAAHCQVCDWPLATDQSKGCVPGNCAYRPDDPAEQERIRSRRAQLSVAPTVRGDREKDIEAVAGAIDAARYNHPDHPRPRLRPFADADRSDQEYAMRLAKAALLSLPVQPGADERVHSLLKQLAFYYEVNDCQERDGDDALEVPIRDLKEAKEIFATLTHQPPPSSDGDSRG